MRRFGAAALIAAVLLSPAVARAHQASVSYSIVDLGDDGIVKWSLRLSSRDLYEALALDRDRDATDAEIRAGRERLFAYVFHRLGVLADGRPCPLAQTGLAILQQTQRFAELRFQAACPLPLHQITLTYDLFYDLDPRHTGMLQVRHGDRSVNTELTRGLDRFDWTMGVATAPRSFGLPDYVWKGMEHIYTGYDHIAFVIGLLLVAAVRPGPRGWRVRPFRRAVPYVLKVVTAFTLAHSITLILAALDVIQLPSRFVESAIAASIVWVAVENVIVAEPRHRWPLAFTFGLVHGLGFAAMLRPILPRGGVIIPLVSFNVGVEIGQLTIVGPLLPLLWLFGRSDPRRYRRIVVLGASAVIAVFGLMWLIERVLDVKLLASLV